MPTNTKFLPCIPTRAARVPAGPDWLHEVKYDGFRMIVERDGDRVRLFTRNGHDWLDRYPWIVDSARRLRQKQFVMDGEAVVLIAATIARETMKAETERRIEWARIEQNAAEFTAGLD